MKIIDLHSMCVIFIDQQKVSSTSTNKQIKYTKRKPHQAVQKSQIKLKVITVTLALNVTKTNAQCTLFQKFQSDIGIMIAILCL